MTNDEKPGITNADELKVYTDLNRSPDKISFPTYFGHQLLEKNQILLFQSVSKKPLKGACWEVMLTDKTTFKLNNRITAEKTISRLPKDYFFQISQSYIINLAFLDQILNADNECRLNRPHDQIRLSVSREQMTKLKAIYNIS